MNWMMTRPGRVKFERGEPFCFITLSQDKELETFEVLQRSLESEDELRGQYEAWSNKRADFNERLHQREPEAMKAAWQRYYFKGEIPDDAGPAPKSHVNKRRMNPLKLGG